MFTVNTQGNNVEIAKNKGYHAYYANGVTAIEVKAKSKKEAKRKISFFAKVLYVFE